MCGCDVATSYDVAALLLPALAVFPILIFLKAKKDAENQTDSRLTERLSSAFGDSFGLAVLLSPIIAIVFIWGIIPAAIISLLASLRNEEKRQVWKDFAPQRSAVLASWLVILLATASLPTSTPNAVEKWGEPISKKNPDAPMWPASEQHMWLLTSPELAVVTHTTTRIPGVFNPVGSATLTDILIDVTGADEKRLKAAVTRMGEETILRGAFSADDFDVVEIPSEGHHRYFSSELGIDTELVVSRSYITYDMLIPDSEVLQVVTIHRAEWGGVVHTLNVVRLPNSSGDVWAEDVVLEWLSSA